ncbi:hypothetical protein [Enterococcus casseliflavus]
MSLTDIDFYGFAVYSQEITNEMIQTFDKKFEADTFPYDIHFIEFSKTKNYPNLLEISCSTTVRSEEPFNDIVNAISLESLEAVYLEELHDDYSTGEKYSMGISEEIFSKSVDQKIKSFIMKEIDKYFTSTLKIMGFIIFNKKIPSKIITDLNDTFRVGISDLLYDSGNFDISFKHNISKNKISPMLLEFEVIVTSMYQGIDIDFNDIVSLLYLDNVEAIMFNSSDRPTYDNTILTYPQDVKISSDIKESIDKEINYYFKRK